MVRVLSMRALRAVRPFALACLVAMVASILVASAPRTAGAETYPGVADIAAAKAAVADAQTGVAQLDAAIVSLDNARQAAETEALIAADRYSEAKDAAERTQRDSFAAAKSAHDAAVQLEAARSDLAGVAQQAYRDGGTMTSVEAIVGAEGFADVISRTEDNDRAATQLDAVTQRVKAAELYADTMSDFAKTAADSAAVAADAAATALVAAQDAQRSAEQAVADAETTREAAMVRLASLQHTTVALQRQRQQGLANERAQRDRDAYETAILVAQEKSANDAANATAAAAAVAANSGGTTGGSTPPATGGSTPPATGGSGGGTPTPPPATGGGGAVATGTPKSGAEAGASAAAFAQTLLGSPYQLGGNGPGYDCSGLTAASWGSVGVTLPHSSRSQYGAVAHVPFSELRPGDLIFWGTNRNASQMYHVAIYIGGGLVVEATGPGSVAKTRSYASWHLGDIMPYAGRP